MFFLEDYASEYFYASFQRVYWDPLAWSKGQRPVIIKSIIAGTVDPPLLNLSSGGGGEGADSVHLFHRLFSQPKKE